MKVKHIIPLKIESSRIKKGFGSFLLIFLIHHIFGVALFADQPSAWALYFQPPATPIMEKLQNFHNDLLVMSFAIAAFVFIVVFVIVFKFREKKNPIPSKVVHNTPLEVFWTLVPTLILIFLAVPSFKIMYMMDHVPKSDLTVKVTGHQWYWSYDYPDQKISYDSYIVRDSDLKPGQPRLLAVDKPLVVPVNTIIEVLLTSTDVIHSWAVPSFGTKKDTVPGKLNQTWIKVTKEGTYYGQCSELCGSGHGFMPIQVNVVSQEAFKEWLETEKTQGKSA